MTQKQFTLFLVTPGAISAGIFAFFGENPAVGFLMSVAVTAITLLIVTAIRRGANTKLLGPWIRRRGNISGAANGLRSITPSRNELIVFTILGLTVGGLYGLATGDRLFWLLVINVIILAIVMMILVSIVLGLALNEDERLLSSVIGVMVPFFVVGFNNRDKMDQLRNFAWSQLLPALILLVVIGLALNAVLWFTVLAVRRRRARNQSQTDGN